MNKLTLSVRIPVGNIIVSDVDDLEAAASRIRAALEFADGIEVDWGELLDNESEQSVAL